MFKHVQMEVRCQTKPEKILKITQRYALGLLTWSNNIASALEKLNQF